MRILSGTYGKQNLDNPGLHSVGLEAVGLRIFNLVESSGLELKIYNVGFKGIGV